MTIDILIQKLWSLREEKRELAQREKTINTDYELLKTELINLLDAQGVSGAKTPLARATISQSQVVKTTDWEAFCAYVKANDAFHLLQKRPAATACKELTTIEGTPPPGIELITLRDITLTTNRG